MSLLVKDIVTMAERQLSEFGVDNAKGDAEAIYCFIKKVPKDKFFMEWSERSDERTTEMFFDLVARRAKREPLQYITGTQGFLDMDFITRPGVLIPRLDSEPVAEAAREIFGEKKGDTVLDLGCGSGVLAVTLAKHCNAKVTAVDISEEACELTKENAAHNNVKIEVMQGDLYEPVKKKKFHMIISNPPYIKSGDIQGLMPEVRDFEPQEALDGGADGLEFYRRIADGAPEHLKDEGLLVLEIGADQAAAVAAILAARGTFTDIQAGQDLAGSDRIITARLLGKGEIKQMEKEAAKKAKEEAKAAAKEAKAEAKAAAKEAKKA